MAEPKSEHIADFCAIANTDDETAKQWLRRYTDLNVAVEAFFDNNGILPATNYVPGWDENVFHADKNDVYGPENRPKASFNIEGSDALSPGIFDASPSRPPSRVSGYPGSEDYSLRKFARGSEAQNGDQEMGVMDQAGSNFRRVDDGYANSGNWAMSLSRFNAREIPPNSDPKERVRSAGAPAFLRPVLDSDYLPGLLTIMQNIPMAKEALLARDISLPDYGNNGDWWDGDRIESSRIMLRDDETPSTPDNNIIYETQRLMAFLELTDRAYGSVANLLRDPGMFAGAANVCVYYLASWRSAMHQANGPSPLTETFNSVAFNDPTEVTDDNAAEVDLAQLGLTVTPRTLQLGGTLYDAVDELMWQESDEDDVLLEVHVQPAEVLCMRVLNLRKGPEVIGLDVPAEFYPARYTREMLDVMKALRKRRVELMSEIGKIAEQHHTLAVLQDRRDFTATRSGIDLLDLAIKHFASDPSRVSAVPTQSKSVGQGKHEDQEMLVDVSEAEPEPKAYVYGEVEQELRALLVRLGEKHQALSQLQDDLHTDLLNLLKAYREPDSHPDDAESQAKLKRYTLRGVCTAPDTTYVLANPSGAEDLLDSPADQWQWWKLTFSSAPGTTSPATAMRVEEADVLHAARYESTEVGLVYASDAAISHTAEPLPTRLKNFVRLDNLAFSREIDETGGQEPDGVGGPWISSSSSASYAQHRENERMEEVPSAPWGEFSTGQGEDDEAQAVDIAVSDDGVGEVDEPPPYDTGAGVVDRAKRKLEMDLLADEDRVLPAAPTFGSRAEERKGG